jgi:hypothetical protein
MEILCCSHKFSGFWKVECYSKYVYRMCEQNRFPDLPFATSIVPWKMTQISGLSSESPINKFPGCDSGTKHWRVKICDLKEY